MRLYQQKHFQFKLKGAENAEWKEGKQKFSGPSGPDHRAVQL